MAEYAKPDERGTDEPSGRDDMLSSSDKWSPPSVEDNAIGNIQLGMILPMCICLVNNCEHICYFVMCMCFIVDGNCFGEGYMRFFYFCLYVVAFFVFNDIC